MSKPIYDDLESRIGGTELVYWGTHRDTRIFLKLEGRNPTGSLKDRTANHIIKNAIESGELKPGMTLLDASSGSYACALTCYGTQHGFDVSVVVNSKVTEQNLGYLKVMGANVIKHGDVTGESRDYCLRLVSENPEKYYFTDQLTNMLAAEAHASSTAPEIFHDLPSVAWIGASMGSGATLLGVSSYVRQQKSKVRVFASVAEATSKPITGTFHPTMDMKSPFIKELRQKNMLFCETPVNYSDAVANACELMRNGHSVGVQGGGLFLAAKRTIEKFGCEGDMVLITGDHAWKAMDKLIGSVC